MIPKFTIGAERLHVTEKYLCNGHWLVTRNAAQSPSLPRSLNALKPLLSAMHGMYSDGIKNGISSTHTAELDQVIPKRDGYKITFEQAQGVEFRADTDEILAYKFQTQDSTVTVGVAARYVPLLRMGYVFAKDAISPLIVLSDRDVNTADVLAVVMPIRLNKSA